MLGGRLDAARRRGADRPPPARHRADRARAADVDGVVLLRRLSQRGVRSAVVLYAERRGRRAGRAGGPRRRRRRRRQAPLDRRARRRRCAPSPPAACGSASATTSCSAAIAAAEVPLPLPRGQRRTAALSSAELRVLALVADGRSTEEAADGALAQPAHGAHAPAQRHAQARGLEPRARRRDRDPRGRDRPLSPSGSHRFLERSALAPQVPVYAGRGGRAGHAGGSRRYRLVPCRRRRGRLQSVLRAAAQTHGVSTGRGSVCRQRLCARRRARPAPAAARRRQRRRRRRRPRRRDHAAAATGRATGRTAPPTTATQPARTTAPPPAASAGCQHRPAGGRRRLPTTPAPDAASRSRRESRRAARRARSADAHDRPATHYIQRGHVTGTYDGDDDARGEASRRGAFSVRFTRPARRGRHGLRRGVRDADPRTAPTRPPMRGTAIDHRRHRPLRTRIQRQRAEGDGQRCARRLARQRNVLEHRHRRDVGGWRRARHPPAYYVSPAARPSAPAPAARAARARSRGSRAPRQRADHRAEDVDPEVVELAGGDRRAEPAGRVEAGARRRAEDRSPRRPARCRSRGRRAPPRRAG